MKLKIAGLVAGTVLLALQSASASAHTDVYVGLQLGVPAPVVVERRPVYYYEYDAAPVVYYERDYPRRYVRRDYEVRYYERHDRGRHYGHERRYR